MSHAEQRAFFEAVRKANVDLVASASVLEIGSYDVNGSMRQLLGGGSYVGVDLADGPGVDVVGYGHELEYESSRFDIAVSGECFEHDPFWPATFSNMARMVRPGGLVAFTCAGRGRPEHGTQRTEPLHSPGTQSRGEDYYRNLRAKDFRHFPLERLFDAHHFWYQASSQDLYFVGVRAGAVAEGQIVGELPDTEDVRRIRQLTHPKARVVRLPLRAASAVMPQRMYQGLALRYMKLVRVAQEAVAARRRLVDGPGE